MGCRARFAHNSKVAFDRCGALHDDGRKQRGRTIFINLRHPPRRSRETVMTSPTTSAALRTAPLTYRVVLLAEDDPVLRRSLSDFLADEGFLVREASDVATVRRCLSEGDPAALVLDLQLSDGDVGEVLRDLKQREAPPNVVLISATSRAERIAREHRVQFIAKPLEFDDLVQALMVPMDERTTETDIR